MAKRHLPTWPLLSLALLAVGAAAPIQSAQAEELPLAENPLGGFDAETSPFAPSVSFLVPAEQEKPQLSLQRYEDEPAEPVMHIMPWTFFAVTAADAPFSSGLEGGLLIEFGAEFGTPIFNVGGFFPMITVAPAIGGQLYSGENRNHGAFHFGVNSLMGFAVANPRGTNVFQFGLMLRGEVAFKRLRYETGEDILGVDGIGSLSAGLFVRYSFLLGFDLAGSAAMFILYDVTDGRREWMVGVDLGGLIIAALLGALSD